MVIAYSGFASLARTQPAQQQIDVPDEVRQQLLDQQNGVVTGDSTSSKEQAVLKAIEEGRINIDPSDTGNQTTQEGAVPPTPPTQEFKLEI